MSADTPLMQQYKKIKEEYKNEILMFRLGDFYEMFFEDAKIASKELGLTLTKRNREKGQDVPLAGVPYHSVASYIAKLVEKGYSVAICDQVEDPKSATGIVKREVTRVIFKTIGEDAATYFNLDGGISFANGKHSLLQRVVISRYFTNLLVRFRGYVEIEGILTTIRYIKKDGTHQQWFTALVRDVLPFILEKRIFDFFIAKDAYVLEARRQKIEELKKQQEQ